MGDPWPPGPRLGLVSRTLQVVAWEVSLFLYTSVSARHPSIQWMMVTDMDHASKDPTCCRHTVFSTQSVMNFGGCAKKVSN